MKKFIFISIQTLLIFISIQAHAFEQTLFPTTAANLTGTSIQTSWNNPNNVKIEDGVVASTSCPGTGTVLLRVSTFNFTVPLEAIILGIKVQIKENENTDIADSSVVLFDVNGSSVGSTDHATTSGWPTPLTYVSYGSSTDLWNKTWRPSDINSLNFGMGIAADRNAGLLQIAEIDAIKMTIYYSQPTTIYGGIIYKATLR